MEEKLLIEAIANYITVRGCSNTLSGNYIFYSSELEEHFGVDSEWLTDHSEEIEKAFDYDIVADCQFYKEDKEYVFDMMFYGNYCDVDMED